MRLKIRSMTEFEATAPKESLIRIAVGTAVIATWATAWSFADPSVATTVVMFLGVFGLAWATHAVGWTE